MKRASLVLVVIAAFFFYACNKSQVNEPLLDNPTVNTSTFEKEATLDNLDEAVDFEIDYFSGSNESIVDIEGIGFDLQMGDGYRFGRRYTFNNCPDVTVVPDDGTYPKTITLNYGDSTVLENGRILSGIIVIQLSAEPRTDGSERTVSFETFMIDSVAITGSTNGIFEETTDSTAVVNMSSDKTYTFTDGFYINKTATKTRTWVSGLSTPFVHYDDVIHIDGSSQSVTSEGSVCTVEITTTLIKKGTCRYIIEGIVTITQEDGEIAILNYGDGTCDNLATLTVNGEEEEIVIGNGHGYNNSNCSNGATGTGNGNRTGRGNGSGNGNNDGSGQGNGNGNGNGHGNGSGNGSGNKNK